MHCFMENLEELFERLHLSCASQIKAIFISEFSILSHLCKKLLFIFEDDNFDAFIPHV